MNFTHNSEYSFIDVFQKKEGILPANLEQSDNAAHAIGGCQMVGTTRRDSTMASAEYVLISHFTRKE